MVRLQNVDERRRLQYAGGTRIRWAVLPDAVLDAGAVAVALFVLLKRLL